MPIPEVTSVLLPPIPPEEAAFVADPARGSRFANPWGADSGRQLSEVLRWQLGRKEYRAERQKPPRIPTVEDAAAVWSTLPRGARVQWLGHATVLVEIDGITAIIDPLFGRAGVVPRAALAPYTVDTLPPIDAVLLTHGHRDHFDVGSLRALSRRFPEALFCVPTGLARALPRTAARVVSLTWWQQLSLGPLTLSFVPAQHWHMRNPLDRNRALWGGWVLQGAGRGLYHSGDTGFFGGFQTIGRVFPGLDVAVLPLGAYEPRWFMGTQHMAPEQSVQALVNLGARNLLGMHWGTFDLTDEPLDHGAFTLLPPALTERGVARERVHVLAHGGGLGFAEDPMAVGAQKL